MRLRRSFTAHTSAYQAAKHAVYTSLLVQGSEVSGGFEQPCQEAATHPQLQAQHALQLRPVHLQETCNQPHTLLDTHLQRQPCSCRQSGQTAAPAGFDQLSCSVNSSGISRQQSWQRRHVSLLPDTTCSHTGSAMQPTGKVSNRGSHKAPVGATTRSTTIASSSSRDDRGNPEPPASAGVPPSGAAASSSNKQQQDRSSAPADLQQQQQQEVRSAGTSTSTSDDIDAAVDAMLDKTWQELKRDLKKELPPEQAAMIDKWEVSDIQTDKVFREIAEQQLGPILELMGIREDPYAFFIDMFKLALMMQLLSAAVVFYGAELGLGLDAGDAFRAVAGLTLGYFLRLSIKIEHLAGPLYNMFVQLLIQENAVYEPMEAKPGERLATLNKLGLTIACTFFIPKLLFGWQNEDCWQIVVPMIGGLFFFDVCYILALLIKLWGRDGEEH